MVKRRERRGNEISEGKARESKEKKQEGKSSVQDKARSGKGEGE